MTQVLVHHRNPPNLPPSHHRMILNSLILLNPPNRHPNPRLVQIRHMLIVNARLA